MRLDKFLAEMGCGSRSQLKQDLKKGIVTVNGAAASRPEIKIDPLKDQVVYSGRRVLYAAFEYFMLNKPAGCVSATEDKKEKTVMDLISEKLRSDLFPVGRLDKDTEGLLLITNDGDLAHRLLSPRRHVKKTYYALVAGPFLPGHIQLFQEGLDIGDEKPTLPATLSILSQKEEEAEVLLSITEGRFHQVKRMFEAVGCKVTYLKRISMGSLTLDESLAPGDYRRLTDDELRHLKEDF